MSATLLLLLIAAVLVPTVLVAAAPSRVLEAAVYRYDADPQGKYFFLDASAPSKPSTTQLCYIFANFSYRLTGWDVVRVTPSRTLLASEPLTAYYACGMLEGYYTAGASRNGFDGASILDNNFSTTPALAGESRLWLLDQLSFLRNNYSAAGYANLTHGDARGAALGDRGENSLLVLQQSVAKQLRQQEGLVDGINRALDDAGRQDLPRWTLYDIHLLAVNAELADINRAAAGQYKDRNFTQLPPGNNNGDHHARNAAAMGGSDASGSNDAGAAAGDDAATTTRPAGISAHPRARRKLHCSVFIKLTDDGDVLFAHNTWAGYNFMYRQLKTYDFETSVSMSSYPGIPSSVDDNAWTGAKLAVTETTNDQDNEALAVQFTVPQTVPYYLRFMAACYHAQTSPAWVALFLQNQSGSYNNQQMVVNMRLFNPQPGAAAKQPKDFFWIAEQMPGDANCRSADMTEHLNKHRAWYSYNLAYFHSVRTLNMDTYYKSVFGDFFSYHKYARAKIFERDGPRVQTLADAKRLIRYNDWRNDALSAITNCSGCNHPNSPHLSIANRADLVPANQSWGSLSKEASEFYALGSWGAIDAKITSYRMMMTVDAATDDGTSMRAAVISGPTADQQPPFDWTTAPAAVQKLPHRGQPDRWNFAWQDYHVGSMYLSPATKKFFADKKKTDGGDAPSQVGRNVGILIGAIVGVAFLGFVLYFVQAAWKRRQNGGATTDGVRRSAASDIEPPHDIMVEQESSSPATEYRQMNETT